MVRRRSAEQPTIEKTLAGPKCEAARVVFAKCTWRGSDDRNVNLTAYGAVRSSFFYIFRACYLTLL